MASKPVGYPLRLTGLAMIGLILSACATTYADRDTSSIDSLAALGGFTTTLPEPKDFVKESRPERLTYIPVGVQPEQIGDKSKPLTAEELLLLQKKLDAARLQNNATTPDD